MNIWNKAVFKNDVKIDTMEKALLLQMQIAEIELILKDVFGKDEHTFAKIAAFIESSNSNKIESIYTTLFNIAYTKDGDSGSKAISEITNRIMSIKNKLTLDDALKVAKVINQTSDLTEGRFGDDFGIYLKNEENGNKTKIFQPTLDKKELKEEMEKLFFKIEKKDKTIIDFIETHIMFEMLHPFPDGNGRIGRLILVKQISSILNFCRILPISWALFKNKNAYYIALDDAFTSFDKGISLILHIFQSGLKEMQQLVERFEIYKKTKIKQVRAISSKITYEMAIELLLSIQIVKSDFAKKYNIDTRTVAAIIAQMQEVVGVTYNTVSLKNKTTYWNIDIEDMIYFELKLDKEKMAQTIKL